MEDNEARSRKYFAVGKSEVIGKLNDLEEVIHRPDGPNKEEKVEGCLDGVVGATAGALVDLVEDNKVLAESLRYWADLIASGDFHNRPDSYT
jgi:hypothetical protein